MPNHSKCQPFFFSTYENFFGKNHHFAGDEQRVEWKQRVAGASSGGANRLM